MPLPAPDFERLFAPGARHTLSGGHAVTIRLRTGAELSLPSGRVAAGEPFMYGSLQDSGGFIQRVPPGRYPVVLILGDFVGDRGNETYSFTTVAAARLVIRDEPVVSWEMAVYDGQDVGRLGDDEFYGYPVDGGTGGFVDVQNIAALCADYDAFIERLLVDFGDSDHDPTAPVIVTNAESEPVVVAFTSGGGDGRYPTWIGRTADGEVACVLTDFFQLPEEEDEKPAEPPREDHLDPAGFAEGNGAPTSGRPLRTTAGVKPRTADLRTTPAVPALPPVPAVRSVRSVPAVPTKPARRADRADGKTNS
ncbi:MAG TPA: DUF4241 domain-containing protein [Actinoallomurus sp.]